MRNFDIGKPTYDTYHETLLSPEQPRKKKRRFKWLLLVLIVITALGWGGTKILSKANKIFSGKQSIFTRVGRLLVGDDRPLQGEEDGQVNILLLGMGGPGHEGPNLTDTMIVASINTSTNEVVLTSIPRDFLVTLPKYGFNKINAAYAYAEKDDEGSGGDAAIAVAEKLTGLKIPYYATIDFKGFVKAVDHVNGLDITVDNTFTDSSYPDYNNGYLAPQTFKKGEEHMNGERALIFARSRHGNNGEGSDFARAERQKKIMVALKGKLMDMNLSDVGALNKLLSDFTDNVRTNLEPFELLRLADIGKKIGDNVYSLSLDPVGDLICAGLIDADTGRWSATPPPPPPPPPVADGEGDEATETPAPPIDTVTRIYVVQPCEGKTLEDIHVYLASTMAVASLQKESSQIEIQNSTFKTYVMEPWLSMEGSGVKIKPVVFKGKLPYERTILYDNSKGSKPKTLEYLKSRYNFTVSDVPYYDAQQGSDFVIILGRDQL